LRPRGIFSLVAAMRAVAVALWALALACRSEPATTPAGSPAPAETPPAPDWRGAFEHTVRWDAERGAIVVAVHVDDGFHVYTTGETIGKPMQLALDEGEVQLDGDVVYPRGVTKDLPIGRSVIVEGDAEVVATVQRPAAPATASGAFRYQVCTDRACDRPRTEPFTVDIPAP
jgi:hypothetical protein